LQCVVTAGLSFADDMAKYGNDVTVFDALHEIGGVLKYGIPKFRLPNKIVDVEIDVNPHCSSSDYILYAV
jgi:NADPH-dependent glutamate synthase beta subunit-like oxidoreductase